MSFTIIRAAAIVAALSAAAPAIAQNDDRRFVLQNHTNGTIREFAVRTNGWSPNWIAVPLARGASRNMHFNARRPPGCVLMTRVVVNYGTRPGVGERVYQQNVDYCGMARLNVRDTGLTRQASVAGPPRHSGAGGVSAGRNPAPAGRYAVRQRVLARFQGGPLYYPATITMIRGASLSLYYADGDQRTVPASHVRPFNWRIGSRIHCLFGQRRGGVAHPGRIMRMTPQGALQIRYDDGDQEWTTTAWCHSR